MSSLTTMMLFGATLVVGQNQSQVLPASKANPPRQMLHRYLVQQSHRALDRRRKTYESLKTAAEIGKYQSRLRKFFIEQLGGFPERGPLNGRVVGRLDGGNYRIEKIIYESRRQHHVTATLYLPKTPPPYPGVLIACGHTKSGKAAGYNQRMGILLAQNGLAALCYDPIGQGERSQILTATGKPKYGSSTREHFLMGVGSILVGRNTASYRTFDGIRGIDYLVSRKDILANKIGCTGCSGGGTLTSYIMALDERVACAAPACYLTTWRRLIDTIGPQDSEQNIFGQVAYGMDHPDYVLMRAPRPTLILATTRDFFDIDGAWDNYRQNKRIFSRLGFPERVDLVEVDSTHGVTKPSREAMVRWMRRWLLGKDDRVIETEATTWTVEQLRCTPRGEVLLLENERSVFDLNRQRRQELTQARRSFWKTATLQEKKAKIRQIANIAPLSRLAPAKMHSYNTTKGKQYTMERLSLESIPGIKLPAIVFVPLKPKGTLERYLFLDGTDKLASRTRIEELARQGHVVLTVELRGIGETENGTRDEFLGPDWKDFYLAYLLGKSMVGMRAEDTLIATQALRSITAFGDRRVHLIASGEAAIPALHAAALHPKLFASVTTSKSVSSWQEILGDSEPKDQFVNTVHNVLRWYDIPQLLELSSDNLGR